jgi:hypothetical protein
VHAGNRFNFDLSGDRRLKAAKKLSDTYKKALQIIEEMTLINMNLLKNDAVEV